MRVLPNPHISVIDRTDQLEDCEPTITVSSELITLSDPGSTSAESIRQLRTRLIAQHIERGRRVLALCSPTAGDGCSFVAANLAVAFAQIGTRVLLINADLRGEGVDRYFGELGRGPGLLQRLAMPKSEEAIGTEILPYLWLLPSGGGAENSQELLSTAEFESLVHDAVREFELVLIDTPPANIYADAQRVAKVAHYCVLVAQTNRTYFDDITELAHQMQADAITVVGTVLNDR